MTAFVPADPPPIMSDTPPEPTEEQGPKRGPGRPRLSDEEKAARAAARAATGGTPNRTRAAKETSLEKQVAGTLMLLNLPLQMIPPLQKDALDPAEITVLAKAIDAQAQISPPFRKYLKMVLGGAGSANLLAVVAMIVTRRLARHGYLGPMGENVDTMLGGALSGDNVAFVPMQGEDASPDE